jgi:sorting nexin-9/18/33
MKAGDEIEVLKEHLPDGWSLVNIAGEAGLIPQTYYTVSGDMLCERANALNGSVPPLLVSCRCP